MSAAYLQSECLTHRVEDFSEQRKCEESRRKSERERENEKNELFIILSLSFIHYYNF